MSYKKVKGFPLFNSSQLYDPKIKVDKEGSINFSLHLFLLQSQLQTYLTLGFVFPLFILRYFSFWPNKKARQEKKILRDLWRPNYNYLNFCPPPPPSPGQISHLMLQRSLLSSSCLLWFICMLDRLIDIPIMSHKED